jgi:hypothetical protein
MSLHNPYLSRLQLPMSLQQFVFRLHQAGHEYGLALMTKLYQQTFAPTLQPRP